VTPWRIAGRYFESCNCEAVCPCRRIGGRPGGRSTYGICFGALGWLVDEGRAREIELSGLAAALVFRYDDDEAGSPWSFVVHIDDRGTSEQREALANILTGELGGDHVLELPWIRKPADLLEVRTSPVAIEHGPSGYALRVAENISLEARRPAPTAETVTCIVPGHHEPGSELTTDLFSVDDAPFEWSLVGNCAFASRFDYSAQ
jgi:hypothetical protein